MRFFRLIRFFRRGCPRRFPTPTRLIIPITLVLVAVVLWRGDPSTVRPLEQSTEAGTWQAQTGSQPTGLLRAKPLPRTVVRPVSLFHRAEAVEQSAHGQPVEPRDSVRAPDPPREATPRREATPPQPTQQPVTHQGERATGSPPQWARDEVAHITALYPSEWVEEAWAIIYFESARACGWEAIYGCVGRSDGDDAGAFQINRRYHATRLADWSAIWTPEGAWATAREIYVESGWTPWHTRFLAGVG
jgi:hypothetical protein